MWNHGCIGDVLSLIQNGVNCKQDKSGVGDKVSRIETIADSNINFDKTGFAVLDEKQKAKAILHEGDILFSHINSPIHVGKTAIYDGVEPLYHGINLLRLQTIDAVDSRYFNMFLISLFQSGYWNRTSKQSVNQASVNQTDIKQVPFSYPPLAEQQHIVSKLDAAFAEIDKAIEIAEAKEVEVRTLLSANIDKIINEVSSTSTEMALDKVAKFLDYRGRTPLKTDAGIKLLTAKNVRMGFIQQNPEEFVSPETYQIHMTRGFPKVGDVVFTTEAPLGLVAQIDDADVALGQRLITFQVKDDGVTNEFLKYSLMSRTCQKKIQDAGTGATVKGIKASLLKKITVNFPRSIDDQAQRVIVIKKIEEHISIIKSTLRIKSKHLRALKSAILAQELQPPQSEAA